MTTLQETIETIRAEEASVRTLFDGDSRVRDVRQTPEYMRRLTEAARFIGDVQAGRRPAYHMREALSTSDFPQLFGDVLDRQLLANWRATPQAWRNYARTSIVNDFREVKRFAVDGAETPLEAVGERAEYPEDKITESGDSYAVQKYGRAISISWEALVNDDLGAFDSIPARFARAANRAELKFVTSLFVDSSGPHASVYTGARGNIVANNPALDIEGLEAAFAQLAALTDGDGDPIVIEGVELVVPPQLEITAQNILNALQIEVASGSGSSQTIVAQNWMRGRVRLNVNPYIPVIATTNGDTSWFLFGNPTAGRPALEVAHLRGHESPALFRSAPDAERIGGGVDSVSFATDSVQFKIRHVFGGVAFSNTGGWRSTVASNGSGG